VLGKCGQEEGSELGGVNDRDNGQVNIQGELVDSSHVLLNNDKIDK
jgi:hypothetical protein